MGEDQAPIQQGQMPQQISPEMAEQARKKLEELKAVVETFQEKILDRFKDYVHGISILPPREEDKEKIAVLILLDDANSNKMPKQQLKEKLTQIFEEQAKEVDERILPEVLLLTELWQFCYDAKYEVLTDIALSVPTYDVGMLGAIKLAETHKQLVLKRFEKYIVCHVLAGSLVQGTATTKSDVDVFIVIDDTDVKKMTRTELRDKLRAIIMDMSVQAGELTGIKNKLNIQVYILTDFWEYVKEANPVVFTFLRDGVPFYDRGIYMPWKQLLEMGKIKPSPEAIDSFRGYGEQMQRRVQLKLKEIGMEDFFWATVTPSQAAIMMYGYPPPTPKELTRVLRDVFVKNKLLEEKFVKTVDKVIKTRKDMEHGTKAAISGAEIDQLYKETDEFLQRIQKLFAEIEHVKESESVLHIYESVVTIVRDVLQSEGHKTKGVDIIKTFEKELVTAGKVPEKFIRVLKDIDAAKKQHDKNALTKADLHDLKKKGNEFLKFMLEYLQRKRGKELAQSRIRVQHNGKVGEVTFLQSDAYIIYDLEAPEKDLEKAPIKENGGLGTAVASSLEEFDDALAKEKSPRQLLLNDHLFKSLRTLFGPDVHVFLS